MVSLYSSLQGRLALHGNRKGRGRADRSAQCGQGRGLYSDKASRQARPPGKWPNPKQGSYPRGGDQGHAPAKKDGAGRPVRKKVSAFDWEKYQIWPEVEEDSEKEGEEVKDEIEEDE